MTTWNAAPMPELGLELVRDVDRERIRSRLPRWDPRLWGDAQFSKNTRPGNRLLKLGLAWGRERVKARKLQQENVTLEGDVAPVSRFTGKEEDVEVGLQYFGKRFLSPYLGRWISADPLAVHAPGSADLNLYAYVEGRTLANVDPLGLAGCPSGQECSEEGTDHPPADADRNEPAEKAREAKRQADDNARRLEDADQKQAWSAGFGAGTGDPSSIEKAKTACGSVCEKYPQWFDGGFAIGQDLKKDEHSFQSAIEQGPLGEFGAAGMPRLGATPSLELEAPPKPAAASEQPPARATVRPAPEAGPYKRPAGATTPEQRASVQGKPCVTCGETKPRMNADHKDPLVEEHCRNNGQIDKQKMREVNSVQPQCPECSNKQGGFLSGFARAMKKLFGFD